MDDVIDMHFHVGLVGDQHPNLGGLSSWYRQQLVFRIFLLYAKVEPDQVNDRTLREATERVIETSSMGKVVCLALDPVYDQQGNRRVDASHVWVDNQYVLDLRAAHPDRILFGASVHPYARDFKDRVRSCVESGAVLLKWLPSAQHINLADPRVGEAMRFLANAKGEGRALPLLLHIGPEYAIPSSDPRTASNDFLTWTWRDRLYNALRLRNRWHTPDVAGIGANIDAALDEGVVIIFAHCGLPYFGRAAQWFAGEHSDFERVREFLEGNAERAKEKKKGRCYADVSACCTPFRKAYFPAVAKLPAEDLLFGGDFPVPVFELSRDIQEAARDLEAVLKGEFSRIIVPQDNLLDVNYRELFLAFPGHPLFTNFSRLLKTG
jgi:predicted TIM-barrel fold metal-dependent hydrolase